MALSSVPSHLFALLVYCLLRQTVIYQGVILNKKCNQSESEGENRGCNVSLRVLEAL